MNYNFLRDIIFIVLVVIAVLLCCLLHSRGKKWAVIVCIVLTLVVGWMLPSIPFENAFYTFSSPDEVFHYRYDDFRDPPRNIILEVQGEKTAILFAHEGSSSRLAFIAPLTEDGWKIPNPSDLKVVSMQMEFYCNIMVFRYKDSQEYYVSVASKNGNPVTVTDNMGSTFIYGEDINDSQFTTYCYCAYVPSLDTDNYVLSINGQQVSSFATLPFSN